MVNILFSPRIVWKFAMELCSLKWFEVDIHLCPSVLHLRRSLLFCYSSYSSHLTISSVCISIMNQIANKSQDGVRLPFLTSHQNFPKTAYVAPYLHFLSKYCIYCAGKYWWLHSDKILSRQLENSTCMGKLWWGTRLFLKVRMNAHPKLYLRTENSRSNFKMGSPSSMGVPVLRVKCMTKMAGTMEN